MLKSTYRAGGPVESVNKLPPGWTEHKAPSGHTYYYNADTKQSTYTRPTEPEAEELQIDYGATQPDPVLKASVNALEEFHRSNAINDRRTGHFTGGRSYQDRPKPGRQGDRPKSKVQIPNCAPWILVKTKYGRRYVHNTETNESFWKFPSEVMMAVIDMDRVEWEKKKTLQDQEEVSNAEKENLESHKVQATSTKEASDHTIAPAPYDSDSYEEVEVTDDEAEEDEGGQKRPRLESPEQEIPTGPVEFDEDDIAFQLAAMEEEEDQVDAFDEDADEEDAEEGLALTEEDTIALFRSLLDENRVNPFSTFDALIDANTTTANAIVEDSRWTALPNMASRRQVFLDWSRDRIAEQKAQEAAQAKTTRKADPRIAYLRFMSAHAKPKEFWPEFKRKFKKEPEMKDLHFADKDREKLYREYINKIKSSDAERRKELVALLKSIPMGSDWNRSTKMDDLPSALEKDLRFYVLPSSQRDELVEVHIGTLPSL